jgi:hypothetical protein
MWREVDPTFPPVGYFPMRSGRGLIAQVIAETIAVAVRVVAGIAGGKHQIRTPATIGELVGDEMAKQLAVESLSVEQVVCAGVTVLSEWLMHQTGPGAAAWPKMLQAWLDHWQQDFRVLEGDERRAYAALLYTLKRIQHDVEISYNVAVSTSSH